MRPSPFHVPEDRTSPIARARNFLITLSPGDRAIAGVLALLLAVSLLFGLVALIRAYQVTVPAYGGSLTEGVIGSPRFINPLLALTDADRDLTALVYAGLMGVDGDGNMVPVLAESYTVSEDGTEYTFLLREHAKFSDNTPVTADDVVFTVEKAQDPALRSPELANWANIRAEALDARTVRFTLPQPYAPFLADTTLGILPARLWRNVPVDEFSFSPRMTDPVGAGPFKVTGTREDKDGAITSMELASFRDYAPGRPYLNRITVKFYDDVASLKEAYDRKQVESAYGIHTDAALRSPYSRVFGAFFNSDVNPVFADIEVRRALSLAVNRARITGEVLGGNATALMGPVPPGSGIEPFPVPEGEALALATEAFTEAGWERSPETGLWSDGDAVLSSVTIKTANVPELKAIALSIEQDWEAFGVPTEVELYEPGDLASSVIRPREYAVLLFGMVIGRDRDLYAFWDSGERSDPGLNIAAYANRSVDLLLESIRQQLDPEIARQDLQEVSTLIAEDYPAAFTHAPDFLYAIPNSVHGVRLPQIAAPADRFVTVANWYRNTEEVWPVFAR